jgi:acetophenone carboxylase
LREKAIKGEYIFTPPGYPLVRTQDGDAFVVTLPGGSGYGDVLERDPELVMKDLREKVISPWVAENVYLVVYDKATHKIDDQETEKRRDNERQNRREGGVPYKEFISKWREKRPKAEIIKYFGPWEIDSSPSLSLEKGTVPELRTEQTSMSQEACQSMKIDHPHPSPPPSRGRVRVGGESSGEISIKRQITEYVDIDLGKELWCCNRCGKELGSCRRNYKEFCLLYERDPRTIHRPFIEDSPYNYAPDPDFCVIVEFYCPNCGVMIENEYLPPGHPITHDIELDIDKLKQERG